MAAATTLDPAAWSAALRRVPSQDFERLLARHYWEQGFEVEHLGNEATGSRFDGGVDLVLHQDGDALLVQCKHWKAGTVGDDDVRQLQALLETNRAQRAILVVSGEFSAGARDAAARHGRIDLVDGAALRTMIDAKAVAAHVEELPADWPWWGKLAFVAGLGGGLGVLAAWLLGAFR